MFGKATKKEILNTINNLMKLALLTNVRLANLAVSCIIRVKEEIEVSFSNGS